MLAMYLHPMESDDNTASGQTTDSDAWIDQSDPADLLRDSSGTQLAEPPESAP